MFFDRNMRMLLVIAFRPLYNSVVKWDRTFIQATAANASERERSLKERSGVTDAAREREKLFGKFGSQQHTTHSQSDRRAISDESCSIQYGLDHYE